MLESLANTHFLVVGGSSGIGLATAKAAIKVGAKVTIVSRSADKLKTAERELGNVSTAVLDTADDEAVQSFFAEGTWDHLVISAAQTPTGSIQSLSMSDAKEAMESKFWGAYRVARAAKIRSGGSLTLVSGMLSTRPSATAVLQGAINAALEGLGRGLALDLAPVRVNTISPGIIDTPLWSKLNDESRENLFKTAGSRLPGNRVGHADEIANAAIFLAATPFATGSTLLVDGGGAIV